MSLLGIGARIGYSTNGGSTVTEVGLLMPGMQAGGIEVGSTPTDLLADEWDKTQPTTKKANGANFDVEYTPDSYEAFYNLIGVFIIDDTNNLEWFVYDRAGPYASVIHAEGFIKKLEHPTFNRSGDARLSFKVELEMNGPWEFDNND